MVKTAAPPQVPQIPWIGKRRPFYGWVIVAVGAATQFTQGVVTQAFGTYLGPLQNEFGWSKTALAGPRSISSVEGAALGPLNGWLVDRFGPGILVGAGSFITGLGLVLFALVHSLWLYYLSNILVSLGIFLGGLLVLSVAINHWFLRKRTLAQSTFLVGFAAAGVVGIPMVVWAQTTMGWRAAAAATGILVWAVGIPGSLLLRSDPKPYNLSPDGDDPGAALANGATARRPGDSADFTLREAVRTRAFWFLCLGNGLNSLAMSAVMVHVFLHLEHGARMSAGAAALVWTVASFTNIPSRFLAGILGDRMPKYLVLGAAIAAMSVSLVILGLATSMPAALAFAVVFGVSWGMRTPIINAMQGDYWGLKAQGTIAGSIQTLTVLLSVAGPVAAGYMADLQGDYRFTFIAMAVANAVGAVFIFLAKPPRPPVGGDSAAHGARRV